MLKGLHWAHSTQILQLTFGGKTVSQLQTCRRVNQQPRKEYQPRTSESSRTEPTHEEQEEESLMLEMSDEWFHYSESKEESENDMS